MSVTAPTKPLQEGFSLQALSGMFLGKPNISSELCIPKISSSTEATRRKYTLKATIISRRVYKYILEIEAEGRNPKINVVLDPALHVQQIICGEVCTAVENPHLPQKSIEVIQSNIRAIIQDIFVKQQEKEEEATPQTTETSAKPRHLHIVPKTTAIIGFNDRRLARQLTILDTLCWCIESPVPILGGEGIAEYPDLKNLIDTLYKNHQRSPQKYCIVKGNNLTIYTLTVRETTLIITESVNGTPNRQHQWDTTQPKDILKRAKNHPELKGDLTLICQYKSI